MSSEQQRSQIKGHRGCNTLQLHAQKASAAGRPVALPSGASYRLSAKSEWENLLGLFLEFGGFLPSIWNWKISKKLVRKVEGEMSSSSKKSSAVNNREKLFFPPQLMIRAKLSCRVFPAKLLFVKAGGVVAIIRDTWLISLEKCMLCRTFEIWYEKLTSKQSHKNCHLFKGPSQGGRPSLSSWPS